MQWGLPATVEETPGHTFLHAWSAGQYVPGRNIWINEIEYAVLDQFGDPARPVTKLTDHSVDTASIYDRYQQVAVAPNGRMAVVWQRRELNASSGQPRVNLQLAILDPAGAPLFGPANLTNITAWGSGNLPGVPSFETPQIAATDDNRFVVAWTQTEQTASGAVNDIYLTVLDTTGASVRGATRVTSDAPGNADGSGFWLPGLAAMDGNAALITWVARSTGNLSYAVISSGGDTVRVAAALTSDGTLSQPNGQADAARLAGGNLVVAWSKGRDRDSIARVVVLDPSGAVLKAPFDLTNSAGPQGNTALSVARAGDKAVLTWRDGYYNYRFRLFYALLSSQGDILTPPMIFRSSEGEDSFLEPGNNTSYSFTPPSGVDTVLRVSPALNAVRPGQKVTLTITYGNHAADLAQGVQLTATLGPSLTYLGDSLGRPAPAQAQASAGGQVVWPLPSLAFLNRGSFEVYLQMAQDATPETISQVSFASDLSIC